MNRGALAAFILSWFTLGLATAVARADDATGSSAPPVSVHMRTEGFDPDAPTAKPTRAEPGAQTTNAQSSSVPAAPKSEGCNALPFILPFIGVTFLVWLRMRKTLT